MPELKQKLPEESNDTEGLKHINKVSERRVNKLPEESNDTEGLKLFSVRIVHHVAHFFQRNPTIQKD